MSRMPSSLLSFVVCILWSTGLNAQASLPDLRTITADLSVPPVKEKEVEPGQRCFVKLADARWQIPYVLYLPRNWDRSRQWPVFFELPGNGGYRDSNGDECSGLPQDCSMGFGLTEGKDWLWVSVPFLNADGSKIAVQWWGDAPQYDSVATRSFWRAVLQDVKQRFCGDPGLVVLAGFSRGAIACNAVGLQDDETAKLWTAFLACSHYDGVRTWPFPDSDRRSAFRRLERLGGRPQWICGEGDQPNDTETYLAQTQIPRDHLTIMTTGFRNHSDQWTLRPCECRTKAREWLVSLNRIR